MPRAKPKQPAQWAASVIEQRPVLSLLAYAANARTHSDAQVAQIAASIREFGFVNPVLVDEGGEIIAGHGRVMAAKLLGMATVPTIERGGLSDAQRRALRLADLAAELTALSGMEFDLDLIGFDTSELDALIRGEPAASPAAVLEPFSGSGTTILAGQRTGRRVRAIELAPDYVDLAIARWQILHPNIPVTLDGDGRSFVAIAEERANG